MDRNVPPAVRFETPFVSWRARARRRSEDRAPQASDAARCLGKRATGSPPETSEVCSTALDLSRPTALISTASFIVDRVAARLP